MGTAKVVLWICGIGLMLSFIAAVLPWHMLMAWLDFIGVQTPEGRPLTVFIFRVCLTLFGFIGIFFIILARNPLAYGPMLKLAAYGLIIWGFISLGGGYRYGLPAWTYVPDFVFGIAFGGYLIAFSRKQT